MTPGYQRMQHYSLKYTLKTTCLRFLTLSIPNGEALFIAMYVQSKADYIRKTMLLLQIALECRIVREYYLDWLKSHSSSFARKSFWFWNTSSLHTALFGTFSNKANIAIIINVIFCTTLPMYHFVHVYIHSSDRQRISKYAYASHEKGAKDCTFPQLFPFWYIWTLVQERTYTTFWCIHFLEGFHILSGLKMSLDHLWGAVKGHLLNQLQPQPGWKCMDGWMDGCYGKFG